MNPDRNVVVASGMGICVQAPEATQEEVTKTRSNQDQTNEEGNNKGPYEHSNTSDRDETIMRQDSQ